MDVDNEATRKTKWTSNTAMYMNIDDLDKRKKGNVGLKVKGARLSVSHGKG